MAKTASDEQLSPGERVPIRSVLELTVLSLLRLATILSGRATALPECLSHQKKQEGEPRYSV